MSIIKEKYSSNRINLIYQILNNEAEQGQPKEYDIRVDELKVVSRTADPERFYQHEDFVQPETSCITICLYDGGSRRCTRYVLMLKEEEAAVKNSLDGIEHTINEKLQQERRQWLYEQMQQENDSLKAQLEEAEQYQEELQDTILQLRTEKGSASNKITETVLNLAGLYLSKNPQALGGIPILGELVGSATSTPANDIGDASYSKQETDPTECLRMAFAPFFPELYINKIMAVIQYFNKNNGLVDEVLELLSEPMATNATHTRENSPEHQL